MFEKIEKFQLIILAIIIAAGVFMATKYATNSLSREGISVTGSAYEVVTSDSGKLYVDINIQAKTKTLAHQQLKIQLPKVQKYFKDKGFEDINIKNYTGYYTYRYNYSTGNYTNEVESYKLMQPIEVTSKDVNKIKEVALDVQNLIDNGIDVSINNTEYYYSNLSELKIRLLQAATNDAKERASAMLKATHNRVGKIQSVKMGVFQITEPDSTNVSDMGINDTSTIEKKVTAVANVVFKIK